MGGRGSGVATPHDRFEKAQALHDVTILYNVNSNRWQFAACSRSLLCLVVRKKYLSMIKFNLLKIIRISFNFQIKVHLALGTCNINFLK